MEDLGAYIFFGLTIFFGYGEYIRMKHKKEDLEWSLKDAEKCIKILDAQNTFLADLIIRYEDDSNLQDEIDEITSTDF